LTPRRRLSESEVVAIGPTPQGRLLPNTAEAREGPVGLSSSTFFSHHRAEAIPMASPLVDEGLFDHWLYEEGPAGRPARSAATLTVGEAPVLAAPSALSTETARSYIETRPFRKLGAWGETILVARQGVLLRTIRWLALHRGEASSYGELWRRCQAANPSWFVSYRTVRMIQPSFFLPAGEVAFEAIENPTQIPDRPPRGVMLRHWEALTAAPRATFYFLRPVFKTEPYFRLCGAGELREEAEADRDDAIFAARLYGGPIRAAAWCRRRVVDAARIGVRASTLAVRVAAWLYGAPLRARSRRLADEFHARYGRGGLDDFLSRTSGSGLAAEVAEFRRALLDLRARLPIDPILCFELSSRPGELWFEAHWYEGRDGRTYVAY
jgi:hypothetical protein